MRHRRSLLVVGRRLRVGRRPRVESNHRTELRRLPLCPLSYGAERSEAYPPRWRAARKPPQGESGGGAPAFPFVPPSNATSRRSRNVTAALDGSLHLRGVKVNLINERVLVGLRVANGTRTRDHRDHNPGLYQLSYRHHARTMLSADRGSLATLKREPRRPHRRKAAADSSIRADATRPRQGRGHLCSVHRQL